MIGSGFRRSIAPSVAGRRFLLRDLV